MFEKLMKLLVELDKNEDVYLSIKEKDVRVIFNDFEGFDEDDWSEIDHDYVDPVGVEQAEDMLESFCHGDFYLDGDLDGYHFHVGYSSYDI